MAKPIEISHDIAAPPERVFALSTDVVEYARFVSGIESTELLTDGPTGLGTRFRETRILFGKTATEEMEVVAWDPPRSWILGATSCGCEYRTEMRYEPHAGGTRVTMVLRTRPLTFFARLMSVLAPLMKGTMLKCLRADLADLQRAAESR